MFAALLLEFPDPEHYPNDVDYRELCRRSHGRIRGRFLRV